MQMHEKSITCKELKKDKQKQELKMLRHTIELRNRLIWKVVLKYASY